jgi:hypothetical protein
MKFSRTRKRWHFNTGDCLIEVTTWAGLTVYTTKNGILISCYLAWAEDVINEKCYSFITYRKLMEICT